MDRASALGFIETQVLGVFRQPCDALQANENVPHNRTYLNHNEIAEMTKNIRAIHLLALLSLPFVLHCASDDNGEAGEATPTPDESNQVPITPRQVDGVTLPIDVPSCTQGLTPVIMPSAVTFEWEEVDGATGYVIQAFKTEGSFEEVSDDLLVFSGLQETTGYNFGERATGFSYLVQVHAAADGTALCRLDGFNIAGPF